MIDEALLGAVIKLGQHEILMWEQDWQEWSDTDMYDMATAVVFKNNGEVFNYAK